MTAGLAPGALARDYGPVSVTAMETPRAATAHGYAAYRLRVVNRDPESPHVVTLQVRGGHGGRSAPLTLRRRVKVAAGATARVSLLQPPLPCHGPRARVTVDGRRGRKSLGLPASGHMVDLSPGYGPRIPTILLGAGVGRELEQRVRARLEKRIASSSSSSSYSGGASPDEALARAKTPPARWGRLWLAHSRFDAIVLRAATLEAMPGDARRAVARFVSAGGHLCVIGSPRVPIPGTRRAAGAGSPALEDLTVADVGFGRVWRSARAPDGPALDELTAAWARAGGAFDPVNETRAGSYRRLAAAAKANRAFPVIEDFGVPVRGLLALIAVFAVVIGPVNFFVLARLDRRICLLATVPILGLLFAGATFASALLYEGWTPRVRSAGITLLDQPARRATSIGRLAYYAPVHPGRGLRFDRRSELTPIVSLRRAGGAGRTVDWTRGQHLASGWITARVPAHFLLRRSERRRERLVLRRAEGTARVTNGLGARIERLLLADGEGRVYEAPAAIPPGQKAALRPTGRSASGGGDLSRLYRKGAWADAAKELGEHPGRYLRPRRYVAVVRAAPFVDPGLEGSLRRRDRWVVYGILGGGSDGG